MAVRFAICFLLPAVSWLVMMQRSISMDRYITHQHYEAQYYLPSAESLAILSLGHREALADLVWMKALVYFGDELRHRGEVSFVYRYADAILHLDPDFRRAYRWVGVAGLYRPNETPIEEMRPALDFLRRGAARFPDDADMAWDLGSTLLYEIAPLSSPDEQEALRAEAIEHLVVAVRGGAAPPWVALSNLTHLRQLGQLDRAAAHLREAYALADDDETRTQIAGRLAEIEGATAASSLQIAHERLVERWRSERPWVPFEFFWLVTHEP